MQVQGCTGTELQGQKFGPEPACHERYSSQQQSSVEADVCVNPDVINEMNDESTMN